MAPSKKEGKTSRKKKKVEKRNMAPRSRRSGDIELYCVCRQPWDGNSLMVQCDACQDWFHPKCVGVSRKDAKHNPFICPQCQDKPILKLTNYKMGSYTNKMQTSYYECLDPKRLYQLYSIPNTNYSTYNEAKRFQSVSLLQCESLKAIAQKIMHKMSQHSDTFISDIQFYHELITFITDEKNKIEISHMKTIHECHKYLSSCLFTKHCDLMYNMKKSKPYLLSKIICDEKMKDFVHDDLISNITSKYNEENEDEAKDELMMNCMSECSLIDVWSIMCLNCNGQITTNNYMDHITQCYRTKHAFYEQALESKHVNINRDQSKESIDYEDVLFASKYKSKCIPLNPLEMDINEEIEYESDMLSVPDIFDRKKVLKQLIAKQNKKNINLKHNVSNGNNSNVSNEILDKIYCKLLAEFNELESSHDHEEEEEDDDDDEDDEDDYEDDDDDIPIAQNIIKNIRYNYNLRQRPSTTAARAPQIKHKPAQLTTKRVATENTNESLQFEKIEDKFKRYYKENKIRKLKRKQKEFQMKYKFKHRNNHKYTKYNSRFESDKIIINKLYYLLRLKSKSNNLLSIHASKELFKKLLQFNVRKLKARHCGYLFENIVDEQKTMRMEVDDEDHNDDDDDDNSKYSYFCHEKLLKNGLCPIHKNWRAQKYEQLLSKLKNEIEQIFLLKCSLKQINNLWNNDKEKQKVIEEQQRSTLFNDSNIMNIEDISPSISIKINENQTNIDLLLRSMTHKEDRSNLLQNIENNAVMFPQTN